MFIRILIAVGVDLIDSIFSVFFFVDKIIINLLSSDALIYGLFGIMAHSTAKGKFISEYPNISMNIIDTRISIVIIFEDIDDYHLVWWLNPSILSILDDATNLWRFFYE